jgi:hypothetical protein
MSFLTHLCVTTPKASLCLSCKSRVARRLQWQRLARDSALGSPSAAVSNKRAKMLLKVQFIESVKWIKFPDGIDLTKEVIIEAGTCDTCFRMGGRHCHCIIVSFSLSHLKSNCSGQWRDDPRASVT